MNGDAPLTVATDFNPLLLFVARDVFAGKAVELYEFPAESEKWLRRVHRLKISLTDAKPPIWRRLRLPADTTLAELHQVIQAAFGWWNYHLHEFEVGRTRYGVPDPDEDWGEPPRDERRTRLDAIAGVGSSFRYTYDFGDGWQHRLTVTDIRSGEPGA